MAKNTKKIIQALTYLAFRMPGRTLEAMKAYKLLWLADRCHLRQHGRTITGDRYYALPKGMVPTDAKYLLDGEHTQSATPDCYFDRWIKKISDHKYRAVNSPDFTEFSQSDIEILSRVIDEYGSWTAKQLSELSHKYPEWKEYEAMLSDKNEKNSFPINIDLMFENTDADHSCLFMQSPEMLEITREIYHELHN